MKTTFKLELDKYQYARLQALAEERGLTPDETTRLILIFGINWRYRALQLEKFQVARAERLAREG